MKGRARMVSYFNVASSAILIYDWFLTIPLEVATIWRSKWSLTKVLFITTRYIAYLQLVDIVYYYPRSPTGTEQLTSAPKVCQITYEIHTWSVAIGVGAGEALLSLRTWAVWGSSRKMGVFLGILWIITWSSAFALVVMFLQKIQYGVTPLTSYVVCYATARSSTTIFWTWVIFLLWNTLMFVLMAIPAYKSFQESGGD
ncbi:unnamed protein product [Cyclocybe aegerita]|uniref:DUF6533 domain-containing protein n=1 Tax=Cyclocybe aegerita TaxID=1973307 RepID=A0A8S0WWH9_CYCAE|nr:unnamed protein product [Cyclocybe aegerita]